MISTDYSPESGARATRQLLSDPEPPTAIAYDSDVLAVTGLGVAQQMGFSVPDDVSIVAWDDSLLCQVVHPPLTTLTRDISAYGALACRRLLAAIDGRRRPANVEAPRGELTPRRAPRQAPATRRPPHGLARSAGRQRPRTVGHAVPGGDEHRCLTGQYDT